MSDISDSESDFDEDALRKEFDDGYDAELVGDEEDRIRLENMTEKEREQELYNRLEKREALQKRYHDVFECGYHSFKHIYHFKQLV